MKNNNISQCFNDFEKQISLTKKGLVDLEILSSKPDQIMKLFDISRTRTLLSFIISKFAQSSDPKEVEIAKKIASQKQLMERISPASGFYKITGNGFPEIIANNTSFGEKGTTPPSEALSTLSMLSHEARTNPTIVSQIPNLVKEHNIDYFKRGERWSGKDFMDVIAMYDNEKEIKFRLLSYLKQNNQLKLLFTNVPAGRTMQTAGVYGRLPYGRVYLYDFDKLSADLFLKTCRDLEDCQLLYLLQEDTHGDRRSRDIYGFSLSDYEPFLETRNELAEKVGYHRPGSLDSIPFYDQKDQNYAESFFHQYFEPQI